MFPIRDTIPSRTRPVVVYTLIAINVAVFVYESMLPEQALRRLFYLAGIVPARFGDPAWAAAVGLPPASFLPFLSSMFLHGGFLHLLSNMWSLWIFGDNVEDRMGHMRFLAFYLLSGLLAGGVHTITDLASAVPTIGASGAIAGVLGAYLVLYPHSRVLTLIPIFFYPLLTELPAFVFLGIWFLSQLFSGTMSTIAGTVGGVAWWAHIGGFIAGVALYRFFLLRKPVYAIGRDPRTGRPIIVIDRRDPPT